MQQRCSRSPSSVFFKHYDRASVALQNLQVHSLDCLVKCRSVCSRARLRSRKVGLAPSALQTQFTLPLRSEGGWSASAWLCAMLNVLIAKVRLKTFGMLSAFQDSACKKMVKECVSRRSSNVSSASNNNNEFCGASGSSVFADYSTIDMTGVDEDTGGRILKHIPSPSNGSGVNVPQMLALEASDLEGSASCVGTDLPPQQLSTRNRYLVNDTVFCNAFGKPYSTSDWFEGTVTERMEGNRYKVDFPENSSDRVDPASGAFFPQCEEDKGVVISHRCLRTAPYVPKGSACSRQPTFDARLCASRSPFACLFSLYLHYR